MTDDSAGDATVLLVDDDAAVRLVTGLLLKKAGYRTYEASNGFEAIAALRDASDDIDVILLDVMMPEMTGPEALGELRAIVPTIPVIFYSGYAESEVAAHLVDQNAHTSFLPKPTDVAALAARIEEARGSVA